MVQPKWALPGHVHVCVLEEDIVFLDLASGEYSSLVGVSGAIRLVDDGEVIAIDDETLAAELAAARLIEPATRHLPRPRRRASERLRDLSGDDQLSSTRCSLGEIAQILLNSVWLFHRRSLAELVQYAQLADRQARPGPQDAEALAMHVQAFWRALAFVPFQGECLYRAFLLLLYLRRGGFDAQWVFGVRTWPFHAHCWLQSGELVLDDSVDRLVAYQPILAV